MAAEQGGGAALSPALTQVLEYDLQYGTFGLHSCGRLIRTVPGGARRRRRWPSRRHFVLIAFSVSSFQPRSGKLLGRPADADGRKSDDNDDTCSHSGLTEEEEKGREIGRDKRGKKEMAAAICSLYSRACMCECR